MPIYTFKCADGSQVQHRMSIADYESVCVGEKLLLDETDAPMEPLFDPGSLGFVLVDGISGGWATKANKEREYRKRRHAEMGRRQDNHAPKTRLVPNLNGKMADRWSDIQDHVRSTAGAAAAATYNDVVAKEQGKKK